MEAADRHEKNIFQKKTKTKEKLMALQIKALENGQKNQPFPKPPQQFKQYQRTRTKKTNTCFTFGTLGHYQRDCPQNGSRPHPFPKMKRGRGGRFPYSQSYARPYYAPNEESERVDPTTHYGPEPVNQHYGQGPMNQYAQPFVPQAGRRVDNQA